MNKHAFDKLGVYPSKAGEDLLENIWYRESEHRKLYAILDYTECMLTEHVVFTTNIILIHHTQIRMMRIILNFWQFSVAILARRPRRVTMPTQLYHYPASHSEPWWFWKKIVRKENGFARNGKWEVYRS